MVLLKYILFIRSTESFNSHGIYWADMSVNLPYFDLLYVGKYNNYLLSFRMESLMPYQYKYLRIIVSVLSDLGRKEICITFILYTTLEYWCSINFIFVRYQFKIHITSFTGRTSFLRTVITFIHYAGVFPLILVIYL